MWLLCWELFVIVSAGLISAVIVYYAAKRLGCRKLYKRELEVKAKIEANGRNLRTLTDMINNSPRDTGEFESIED